MNLIELFSSLSDGQKQAIDAYVRSGFSPSVSADELNIGVPSFEDRMRLARKKIKKAGYPSTVSGGLKDTLQEMLQEVKGTGAINASAPQGFTVAKVSQETTGGVVSRQWVSYQKEKPSDSGADWEVLKADLRATTPRSKIKSRLMGAKAKKQMPQKMAVYVLADIHFGMYAHAAETGENHDIKISKADVLQAVQDLVDVTPPAEEAMLLNLGDFFHANSREPVTPHGKNQLDVDSRFSHVAREGVELMRTCIEMISERHKKVTLVNVRGNHDPDAAMWLNIVMEAHYGGNDKITVMPNESKMIPFSYGKTALFFYHGEKLARAHEFITGHPEHKKLHGNAVRTYCLAGHIHHETVKTKSNIRFETFSTITGKDAYHADNLYHAVQNMCSIVYDKNYGEVNRSTVPIERVRDELRDNNENG